MGDPTELPEGCFGVLLQYPGSSGAVRDQAQMVSGRVKEQPLIALMIAAAVGWIIGRVMR